MKIRIKAMISSLLVLVCLFTMSFGVLADTWYPSTDYPFSGWIYLGISGTTTYNLAKTKRTFTYHSSYKNSTNKQTGVTRLTDNYYHSQGNNDVSTSISCTRTVTYTVSGGVSKIATAQGSYGASVSSSRSVTNAVPANQPTGYYYYGVFFKGIWTKDETRVETYKKNNKGYWIYQSSSTSCSYGGGFETSGYYSWYRA